MIFLLISLFIEEVLEVIFQEEDNSEEEEISEVEENLEVIAVVITQTEEDVPER